MKEFYYFAEGIKYSLDDLRNDLPEISECFKYKNLPAEIVCRLNLIYKNDLGDLYHKGEVFGRHCSDNIVTTLDEIIEDIIEKMSTQKNFQYICAVTVRISDNTFDNEGLVDMGDMCDDEEFGL